MFGLPFILCIFYIIMKNKCYRHSWLLSAGDDYDAQPSRSFFAFSSTTNVRMCTTVTIFDDDSFEEDVENFFANLALASTAPRVMIDPSQAEIQINDDDSTF